MTDTPHPMDLEATLNRMEPGVSVPGIEQSLASIAISLKRIADAQDYQMYNRSAELGRIAAEMSGNISSAIHGHSTKVVTAR